MLLITDIHRFLLHGVRFSLHLSRNLYVSDDKVARTVCRCSALTRSRGCADVVGSPGYTLSLLHTICVSGTGNHLTVAELEAQRMPAMT